MGRGTLASLVRSRFPTGERTELILKPDRSIEDVVFKKEIFERFNRTKTVVAGFDNEPKNVNALIEAFPDSTVVYLDTRHSPSAPKVDPRVVWVRDFQKRPKRVVSCTAKTKSQHLKFSLMETAEGSDNFYLKYVIEDLADSGKITGTFSKLERHDDAYIWADDTSVVISNQKGSGKPNSIALDGFNDSKQTKITDCQ